MITKLAKENHNKRDAAILTGAGAIGLNMSRPNIAGYHKVYHGTSKSNAEKILREGYIDPKKGGINGASANAKGYTDGNKANFMNNSKGKAYFTKNKLVAHVFGHHASGGEIGKTLKSKMPHNMYVKSKIDVDHDNAHLSPEKRKSYAAHTNKKINVGKQYNFATKNNMKRYLKSGSGKVRFAKGLGQATLGSVALYMAAKKLGDSNKG
jgi:hypothetical protein